MVHRGKDTPCLGQTMLESCAKESSIAALRLGNKRNVGSCWLEFAQHLPNFAQQHATECANGRNKSDIQQCWELFGSKMLFPFKRGLRAAEKHEARIC